MMNSSQIFLFCLLATSLYFLSQHTICSLNVLSRPTRKLIMPALPANHNQYHKTQVADEELENPTAKEDSVTVEYTSNNGNSPHDLVYHTDYHGVTTHPTPKHPKP